MAPTGAGVSMKKKVSTMAGIKELGALPTKDWTLDGEGKLRRNDRLADDQCLISSLARQSEHRWGEVSSEFGLANEFANDLVMAADNSSSDLRDISKNPDEDKSARAEARRALKLRGAFLKMFGVKEPKSMR